jgi:hypothetical protein
MTRQVWPLDEAFEPDNGLAEHCVDPNCWHVPASQRLTTGRDRGLRRDIDIGNVEEQLASGGRRSDALEIFLPEGSAQLPR